VRVGVADHLGWAIAVTAVDGVVVDRRRLELVEPGVTAAPIHYTDAAVGVQAVTALVKEVRASASRAGAAALDALPGPVESLSLRRWPLDFPADIAVQRRVPWEARADAVMYRQLLAELAHERGWAVHCYDARTVEAEASAWLGERAEAVLRPPLGPPWTKDHRVALAATVLAGAG
jgi:hypothetical protein